MFVRLNVYVQLRFSILKILFYNLHTKTIVLEQFIIFIIFII